MELTLNDELLAYCASMLEGLHRADRTKNVKYDVNLQRPVPQSVSQEVSAPPESMPTRP